MDQGTKGVKETRENLQKMSFNFSGCVYEKTEIYCASKIIEVGNIKIGMIGFSIVYKIIDLEKVKNIISDLKQKTDFIIINMHWGEEHKHKFNILQQRYAYNFIDARVDIIIGHHPHVVQGIEFYKKIYFYSLGNFIFDQYFLEILKKV